VLMPVIIFFIPMVDHSSLFASLSSNSLGSSNMIAALKFEVFQKAFSRATYLRVSSYVYFKFVPIH
jgi:hypothetical protein